MGAQSDRKKPRTGRLSKSGPVQLVIFTILVIMVLGALGYVALGLIALHML